MLALSEVQWCAPEQRDLGRFLRVLQDHEYPVLEQAGYNFRY